MYTVALNPHPKAPAGTPIRFLSAESRGAEHPCFETTPGAVKAWPTRAAAFAHGITMGALFPRIADYLEAVSVPPGAVTA
jgi:hypothetical protein